jgi:DNA-binding SARP family transcriptional activator
VAVIGRALRAIGSAAGLVVALVAPPWALATLVGWPLPRGLPDGAQFHAWLDGGPIRLGTLIDAAACVAWLVWAWTLYAVGAACVRAVSARRRPGPSRRRYRIRVAVPLHAAASSAVGSVLLALASHPTTAPTVDGPPVTGTGSPGPTAEPPVPLPGVPVQPGARDVTRPDPGIEARPGVQVGNTWLPTTMAAHVSALGAALWVRRRIRYQPTTVAGTVRNDTDLTPLPATVAEIRRHIHAASDVKWAVPVEVEAAQPRATVVVVGTREGVDLTAAELPADGVGLVGPGATRAARAVLVAALASPAAPDAGDRTVVHTTVDDLITLLGPNATRLPVPAGLKVHADARTALDALEDDQRSRRDGSASDTDGGGLLMVLETPDHATSDRLAHVLAQDRRVRVVLLGAWSPGTTWHVHQDGTVRTEPPGAVRLAVLTTSAAYDILATAAAVTGHDLPGPTSADLPAGVATVRQRPALDAHGPPHGRGHTPARPLLTVRLLGQPSIHRNGPPPDGTPVRVRRSAAWQILIFLATHRSGAGADQLKEAIWADVVSSLAAGRFHTTMSELRRTLREAAGQPVIRSRPDPGSVAGTRYWLDPDVVDVDVWQLQDATRDAAIALDPTARILALRRVVDLYQGELADGHHDEWLQPLREKARRDLVDAAVQVALAEPDAAAAVELLQAAVRHAPHTEALYQEAISRHLAAGRPDAARYSLQTLADRLAPFNLAPSEATQRVAAQLLVPPGRAHHQPE